MRASSASAVGSLFRHVTVVYFLTAILRIEREVELEHVDARPRQRSRAACPSVFASTRRRTSASAMPRSRATRGTWNSAAAGEMCGSNARRRRRHEVDRHRRVRILLARRLDVGLDGVDQLLVRRSELGAGRIGRVVARSGGRRPRAEVARRREPLADEARPDHRAVPLDQLTVGLVRETRPGRSP